MFGEERKVDAVAQPGRAEWIRIAEPGFDWRHRTAFLFTTPRRFATGEVEIHIGRRALARDPASRFEITTAMKHLLHSAVAILLASSFSGCATHVTMIGPARPPITSKSPSSIRLPAQHGFSLIAARSMKRLRNCALRRPRSGPTVCSYRPSTISRLAAFRWASADLAGATTISTAAAAALVVR